MLVCVSLRCSPSVSHFQVGRCKIVNEAENNSNKTQSEELEPNSSRIEERKASSTLILRTATTQYTHTQENQRKSFRDVERNANECCLKCFFERKRSEASATVEPVESTAA